MNPPPESTGPAQRRSRAQIWLLIALFFAPLAAAFLLYYGPGSDSAGWRPAGKTHHGDLVVPARPLPAAELVTPSGAKLDSGALKGKWTLVYIGDGACDPRCREALTLMRQTRLALNDDMSRVQRLFLVTANCCDRQYLDAQHAGLMTAGLRTTSPAADAGQELLYAFAASGDAGRAGRIYIVDPLGNLMMSYAPDAPPKGLLEDLKKLLKLSHIG